MFIVPSLDTPLGAEQACVACDREDCGALTPVRLGALQAAAARGDEFCSEFGRTGSDSEAEEGDASRFKARQRAVKRLRRKGPRVSIPRGSRGRRVLGLAKNEPWGDSNSDSDDMAMLEEAQGGPPKPGAGGIMVEHADAGSAGDEDSKEAAATSAGDKFPLALRVRQAIVESFRVGGDAAWSRALRERRREQAVMWAGGGGGFPPAWNHCQGCGAAVRVPPSLSVLCGQAEEAIVCAPYEDEREEEEPLGGDTASAEAHPFEVEASSAAGSGMAVQALAVAHRRRTNAQIQLRRKILKHFANVSDADASDAQSLLGTAGGTAEDLVLVIAVLSARREAGVAEEVRQKAFDTDSEAEEEPAAAHTDTDGEEADQEPEASGCASVPAPSAAAAADSATLASEVSEPDTATPASEDAEPEAGADNEDVSFAARLQAEEMVAAGIPQAEIDSFLAAHGASDPTELGGAAAAIVASAPPGVMGRASARGRRGRGGRGASSTGRGGGGSGSGPGRWSSDSHTSKATASAEPSSTEPAGADAPAHPKPTVASAKPRSVGAGGRASVAAVAGSSSITARESARIASNVRGTIFGKVSLKGASPEELDKLRVITVTERDLAAAEAAGGDTDTAAADEDAAWRKRGRPTSSCIICCDDLEVGDKVRVLPCLHRMHVRCLDPWLLLKAACPVCHESARKGLSTEVLSIVKALNEASERASMPEYGTVIRSTLAAQLPSGDSAVDSLLEQYERVSDLIGSG
jgi:hypothetical protein